MPLKEKRRQRKGFEKDAENACVPARAQGTSKLGSWIVAVSLAIDSWFYFLREFFSANGEPSGQDIKDFLGDERFSQTDPAEILGSLLGRATTCLAILCLNMLKSGRQGARVRQPDPG